MKKILAGFLSLSIVVLFSMLAWGWGHGNRFGGSTEHSFGSTSHQNAWGGSTSHAYGEGASHTNMYGGSATHYEGGGWSKTGAYGGTAYGDAHYGGAYYHPSAAAYAGYHPPVVVNSYGAGCYNCGGWATAGAAAAGAAVGTLVGAAAASADTAAATSDAYNAGVASGAASAAYVMGAVYPTIPTGCAMPSVGGTTYYLCGNTWFQPSYGANGVFYTVVPAP
jgi:hypothetical protein